MTKEQRWRMEGARFALDMVKQDGYEEAEKELARRGALMIPFSRLDKKEVRQFCNEFKRQVCAIALLTLGDQFDFTRDQMILFERRFNLKTDCLDDESSYEEFYKILKDEYGIDVDEVKEWKGTA